MIILDTNVLSALMRDRPDIGVVAWLDRQPQDSIWITAITLFEARLGVELLPRGKRRKALEDAINALVSDELDNRVLEFDPPSAEAAAALAAERKRQGRPVDVRDTLIAGIATSRRAAIATRNVRHFEGLIVPVINPWET